jgi:lipopolysaccharide/colanic/teichoic acid biosynthesis glycosyltransferase
MRRLALPLLFAGIVGLVLGFSKVHAKWVADPPYDYTGSARFGWSIAYIVLLCVASYAFGLPDSVRTGRSALLSSALASGTAALGISVVQLVTGDALLPRFVVFGVALAMVPWGWLCYQISSGFHEREQGRERVVAVVTPAEAAQLVADLELGAERPVTLLCHFTTEEVRGAGDARPLERRCVADGATLVVLSRHAQADDTVVDQAANLHEHGVRVRSLVDFYDEWLGKLPLSELERVSLLFDIGELHGGTYVRAKRVVDVVLGALGGLVLLLLVPFVFVGNLVGNRGPLLYRQQRVGKGDRVFSIWKFRTMREDTAADTPWTADDDPRVTPFGRILRKSHLDELPQVVNVIKGDLSVVGPRPEQPRYVSELEEKLPFYRLRHLVRPGMTGWAQVKYGYAGSQSDALEKLQYDFYYLQHQGLRLDARIVGRTMRSVVGSDGR